MPYSALICAPAEVADAVAPDKPAARTTRRLPQHAPLRDGRKPGSAVRLLKTSAHMLRTTEHIVTDGPFAETKE